MFAEFRVYILLVMEVKQVSNTKPEIKKEYYITFGQKYRTEPHPKYNWIDPDGYVVIEAADKGLASKKAFELFGQFWSFIYSPAEMHFEYFPHGEIRRFTV